MFRENSASGPIDTADDRGPKKRKSMPSSSFNEPEVNKDSNSINSNKNINSNVNAKASSSLSQTNSKYNFNSDELTCETNTNGIKRRGRKPKLTVTTQSSASSEVLAQSQDATSQSPLSATFFRVSTVSPMTIEPKMEYTATEKLSTPTKEGLELGSVSTRRLPKKRKTDEEVWMEHFYSSIVFKEGNGHLEMPISYKIENEGQQIHLYCHSNCVKILFPHRYTLDNRYFYNYYH